MSETRRYRKFTAQQKLELVMASLRGERSIAELCREHQISESLLRRWRDVALEAAGERLAGGQERSQAAEQRGDRGRGQGKPDRRLPARHGVGAPAARPAG